MITVFYIPTRSLRELQVPAFSPALDVVSLFHAGRPHEHAARPHCSLIRTALG